MADVLTFVKNDRNVKDLIRYKEPWIKELRSHPDPHKTQGQQVCLSTSLARQNTFHLHKKLRTLLTSQRERGIHCRLPLGGRRGAWLPPLVTWVVLNKSESMTPGHWVGVEMLDACMWMCMNEIYSGYEASAESQSTGLWWTHMVWGEP
jgi:hypothetical protein